MHDRGNRVAKRIVPPIRCRLPMRMRSISVMHALARRRLFHLWNLLLVQWDRRPMSGIDDEIANLCAML